MWRFSTSTDFERKLYLLVILSSCVKYIRIILNFISLVRRMLLRVENSIAGSFLTSRAAREHWSKSINERALEDRQVVDESPPIKRLELAAISRPAVAANSPSASRHFRRVNFNNSTPPRSTFVRRWLARFFRQLSIIRGPALPRASERCLAEYRSSFSFSLSLSLFSLSFLPAIVALAGVAPVPEVGRTRNYEL